MHFIRWFNKNVWKFVKIFENEIGLLWWAYIIKLARNSATDIASLVYLLLHTIFSTALS